MREAKWGLNSLHQHVFFRSVSIPPFQGGNETSRAGEKSIRGDSSLSYLKSMYWLPYNKNLKEYSRILRNNSTLGEILLWQKLRAGALEGYKFNRQKPLGRFIVDFYCKRLKLVIEVDGDYHIENKQRVKDLKRQQILESMGLNFL